MPREVTHDATGPRIVTPEDIDEEKGDVAICLCGLSEEYPFCDGTHRRTSEEDPDTLYKYVDGTRRVVAAIEYGRAESDQAADDAESTTD